VWFKKQKNKQYRYDKDGQFSSGNGYIPPKKETNSLPGGSSSDGPSPHPSYFSL